MAGLVLEELSKTYPGGVRALSGVSLTLEGSGMVVLVGPSGCGKTTLLRLVAGLEEPTSGRVLLNHRDLTRMAPALRGVSMVFQDHALYPSRNVRDNLAYPLQVLRRSATEIEAKVQLTATRLGLLDVLTARPGELSGGQRQRVALGRALIRQPSLFLFDEPLSSLDAGLRRQLRRLIKQVQREAQTPAIYVTHDQEEALALADTLVVLEAGRVRQVGTPQEVYARPADRFVAGFVGAMNFIDGRIEGSKLQFAGGAIEGTGAPESWQGREAALGVRPEALRLGRVEGRPSVDVRVSLVEYLGDRLSVTFSLGTTSLTGNFDANTELREGQQVTLSLEGWQWFAPHAA